MKCAPTFGAVPSKDDLQKKEEQKAAATEKREELLQKICSMEALDLLNKVEFNNPKKAEHVKEKLLAEQDRLRHEPASDTYMKQLLEADQAPEASKVVVDSKGLVLDRRRFGDDSDSDIDLDGL